jgi:uncharacterized membrane protein YidH (DUF202 family)
MTWLKAAIGTIAIIVGLVWIGQGLNIIHGSGMSGHPAFSVLGLILVLVGGWLLVSAQRAGQESGRGDLQTSSHQIAGTRARSCLSACWTASV